MTQTARTYGGALYDLAKEESLHAQILADLQLVRAAFEQEPDYMRLLCTPSIPKPERRALIEQAWSGNVHEYVCSFLMLLCDNGIVREFPACADEYRRRYQIDHGILPVRAVSAVELSDALREKLVRKLESITGKTIELTTRVDASLLGGIRLELPERQLDGSVRHHLEQMQKLLKNTVL